ncbi:MAG TPA: DUF420 domain-containing protein [bacterium]
MPDTSVFPSINASLNALAAMFLVAGYYCIRTGRRETHRLLMISAFTTSVLFLVCYLIYHATHMATVFPGQGIGKWLYYTILVTHIILAVTVPPMALVLLYRAWKGEFARHKRLARWALPIWLYVSVTGVVVYWMLYRMQWA